MSQDVRTVAPGATADAAWEVMCQRGIHHLVVTDGGRAVGVLSDRDVAGARGAAFRRDRRVADLMTSGVVTSTPETPVRRIANVMRGRSIGCVVVTDADRIIGIVTVADLLALIGRGIEHAVVSTKRWTLKQRAPMVKQKQSAGRRQVR